MAITVTNTGYIKRTAITSYRNQRRGGKGRIGMRTREEDFVSHLVRGVDARVRDDLLGPRPGLLAEGPRGAGRRARRPRQGHRQPGLDGRTANASPRS